MTNSALWSELRRQMPVTRRWAFFDHAAVAPLTEPARAALATWAEDMAGAGGAAWPQWAARLETLRRAGATLLGAASTDEIALVRNTTEGIGLVAEGYPWQPGDNVVTLADEFPSNAYPWMNLKSRGVETRLVPTRPDHIDLDKVAAACDDRTRIVTISWVGYSTGWRHSVDQLVELAHDRGALLFLDAIQGLGVFPIDVQKTPIDFAAADGHKWLLGPEGAGLMYVRREHLDRLRPLGVGWNSVVHAMEFDRIELDLKPTAARYEGGTYNVGGLAALAESVKLLLDCGIDRIAEQILAYTDEACRRLTEIGAQIISCRQGDHRSGIVAFTLPGRDPVAVRKHCLRHDVVLSCRAGRLRISPHAYNNAEDLNRLVAALTAAPQS